jgi:hypothetical protein
MKGKTDKAIWCCGKGWIFIVKQVSLFIIEGNKVFMMGLKCFPGCRSMWDVGEEKEHPPTFEIVKALQAPLSRIKSLGRSNPSSLTGIGRQGVGKKKKNKCLLYFLYENQGRNKICR